MALRFIFENIQDGNRFAISKGQPRKGVAGVGIDYPCA